MTEIPTCHLQDAGWSDFEWIVSKLNASDHADDADPGMSAFDRLGGRAAPAEFQFVPLARSKGARQSFLTAAELLWADGVASSSVGRMAQLKYAISLGYAALGVRVGPLPKSQLSFASHATSARAIAPRLTRRPPRMRAQEGG